MSGRRADEIKLYIRIAGDIRMMIEDGLLRPGDKLPTLAQLAETFQCSRATIREALSALRGQGLVEFRHGDGTYVRTASVEMWMEPLEAAILLASSQVNQLSELMTALLAGVVTAAAEQRGVLDWGMVSGALFQVECAEPYGEDAVAAELSFFTTLAACCGNALFDNALRVVQEALRSSLRVFNRNAAAERADYGVQVCRSLYDAIHDGNAHGAREIVFAYGAKLRWALERRVP